MATTEPQAATAAAATATGPVSSSSAAAKEKLAAAEKVAFGCEWRVYETGTGVSAAEFARNPNASGKKSTKSREVIATFDNMAGFAKFYNAYPKPGAFFQTRDANRHTRREDSDNVVQVKDVVVFRSHITAEFEDPFFCGGEAGGKCIGYLLRVNRINTADELDRIWSALLFRMVGESLLPEGVPNRQAVACIRAKDMTNRKKQKTMLTPNYRLEMWVSSGEGLEDMMEQHITKIVDAASKDPSAREKMKIDFSPMFKGNSWGGGGGGGGGGGDKKSWGRRR